MEEDQYGRILPNANLWPLFPDQICMWFSCPSLPPTCMLRASLESKQKGLSVPGLERYLSNHILD